MQQRCALNKVCVESIGRNPEVASERDTTGRQCLM